MTNILYKTKRICLASVSVLLIIATVYSSLLFASCTVNLPPVTDIPSKSEYSEDESAQSNDGDSSFYENESVNGDLASDEVTSTEDSDISYDYSEENSSESDVISNEASIDYPDFPYEFVNRNIKSKNVIVYDYTNNILLYAKNENDKAYPASITKLLTSILLIDYVPEDYEITVGEEVKLIGEGSSTSGLRAGHVMTREHLLTAMLLVSGNDAAYVAAVNVGRFALKDQEASIEMALERYYQVANEYVKSLGCKGTMIGCPDGYYVESEPHYTTAMDFLLITKEIMSNYPLIRDISSRKTSKHKFINGSTKSYDNLNTLIKETYINGLKTGYDDSDGVGATMVATGENDGREIIVITLGADKPNQRYEDVKKLFCAAFGWY